MDIQNRVGSWFLNNNSKLLNEVKESSYKRFLTLVSLVEVNYRREYKKHLYLDQPRRDGIVISIPNLMPNFQNLSLDPDILSLVKRVNDKYGRISSEELDSLHKEVLDMFDDPGFLKI